LVISKYYPVAAAAYVTLVTQPAGLGSTGARPDARTPPLF